MKLGIAEARLRLAYINQYREWALGILLALALSARVLGWPLPEAVLVLLGLWFALAWTFVHVSRTGAVATRLHQAEFAYFVLELGLITLLGHFLGLAAWLALLFYVVTILYANMVLPRRAALGISLLAAASFSGLVVVQQLRATVGGARTPQPNFVATTLVVGALGGYALIGLMLTQFSLMLSRQAEALQSANRELNANGQELRLHRDHLEVLVRQRTSDLERASEELRRANADLRRLNELKSSFLANVSHELRTPLTSIRSFSEILFNYPDEEITTQREFLQIIMDESDRLTRLINDVLDLAKIEAGKMEWRMQPVHLADVVLPSLEVVQVVAAHKGLRLLSQLPEDLPLVVADPDRMQQVFTNLLSNAVKFTAAGTIQVGAQARAGELVAYVSDTGIGVPSRDLEHIFEKFHQQGNVLTDKPEGTGLGLSICREIMQRHGGRIWAESREGQGSIFYCALPLTETGAAAAAPLAAPAAAG